MKKLFCVFLLFFPGLFYASDQALALGGEKTSLHSFASGKETLLNDNFAIDEVYGEEAINQQGDPDKPKPSKASKLSQSRRHTGNRTQGYEAPQSGSLRAGSLGGSRGTPTPSNLIQNRRHGKPPLRMSHRDRYFGLGSREFGFNVGTAHGFTDLQGSKGLPFGESLQWQIENPGFAIGVYTKLRMVDWFGLSLGLNYARISGQGNRTIGSFEGYTFENNLVEFNARLAFYAPLASKNEFDIYGFAGLALFNNSLSIQDPDGLPYEPQGDFRNLQPALPFGIGLSWLAGRRLVIGYELGYRYSAFNFLDGIAPVDTRYDAYLINNFKIGIILNPPGN